MKTPLKGSRVRVGQVANHGHAMLVEPEEQEYFRRFLNPLIEPLKAVYCFKRGGVLESSFGLRLWRISDENLYCLSWDLLAAASTERTSKPGGNISEAP